MNKVAPYAKAVVAGVTAGVGAYATAMADGQVAGFEWVGVAAAVVVASAGVFAVPNKSDAPAKG